MLRHGVAVKTVLTGEFVDAKPSTVVRRELLADEGVTCFIRLVPEGIDLCGRVSVSTITPWRSASRSANRGRELLASASLGPPEHHEKASAQRGPSSFFERNRSGTGRPRTRPESVEVAAPRGRREFTDERPERG